jgi:mxaJ protein
MSSASDIRVTAVVSAAVVLMLAGCAAQPRASGPPQLRVCADPNNLPFSNQSGEGFENRLAEIVAADLGREVRYTWWPQRRGFVRNTLNGHVCDVVMGVPAGDELTRTTHPYYRSTYVFVTRRRGSVHVHSFDDPLLKTARVGIHVVGDDYSNVPPGEALARRGILGNVRGYSIFGDYARPNPPAELIAALARGDIDVAIAWGPLAGYFATRERVPLDLTPVPRDSDPVLRYEYAIAMGVRRDDADLSAELDRFIIRRKAAIDTLLRKYGVPLVGGEA